MTKRNASFREEVDFSDVDGAMLWLGRGALSHANWHAHYHNWDNMTWPQLSVLQAAHAAEILIKARIAEEHPLLIFESLPKPKSDTDILSMEHLIDAGRTVQWKDLPDRLWATTGKKLPNRDLFEKFGRLRNSIQHFAAHHDEAGLEASRFIFGVIDPFIHENWGLYAVDHNEDHEPYRYLVQSIIANKVEFLISPDCAAAFLDDLPDFGEVGAYADLMRKRFEDAISVLT
ncbi:MAG: hypothetical protein MUF47_06850 [Porphyrobacter sp.]|nr:hypothetical protein [Porphyrobacter sp.]